MTIISRMRSTLSRFSLILCLSATLLAGMLAMPGAPDVAAMPRYTCSQALALSSAYLATGNVFYGLGDYQTASYYYGKASAYADFC